MIHGTFIVGLPGETRATLEETIRFACEVDPHTIQVSLASPYPGTEFYRQAQANHWFSDNTLVNDCGFQLAAVQYEGLSSAEIALAAERLYRKFYFRPAPIARITWEMLRDFDMMRRRLREGREFLQFMSSRRKFVKAQVAANPAALGRT